MRVGSSARKWLRHPVRLAGAGVVVLGLVVGVSVSRASSAPNLPPVAADLLLASVAHGMASTSSVSGDVAVHANLGLPSDVLGYGVSALGPLDLLAGDHTLRVWSSTTGLRLVELLPAAERSVIVDRTSAWAWDSQTYTAYRIVPAHRALAAAAAGRASQAQLAPGVGAPSPLAAARAALAAVTPMTSVTVGRSGWVAGRAAYDLVIEPRSTATLIGRIDVMIDAATRVPLGVSVTPRGVQQPAASVQFTSVSFGPVDPSLFRFSPPPGAVVKTLSLPALDMRRAEHHPAPGRPGAERKLAGSVRVLGTGWTTVVAVRVPGQLVGRPLGGGLTLASLLPYSGPLLSARLAVVAGQNWVLAGAVPQSTLRAAADTLR